MTLYEELGRSFKLKVRDGESYSDFAARAIKVVNKATDAQWNELSAKLQTWNNDVMRTNDGNDKVARGEELGADDLSGDLPPLEGFPPESDDAEGGDAGTEEGADESTGDDGVDSADENGQDDEPKNERRSKPDKTSKPNKEPERRKMREATAEKEKPAKAPKAAVAKKATTPRKSSENARTRLDPEKTIKIIAKENPHRTGSGRFNRWKKYKEGMTVGQALKAGLNAGNIHHSIEDGHIKLV